MSIQVDTYGLHTDGNITWLCQGRGGTNFVGLRGQCPFSVTAGMCNHLIPAAAPVPDRIHWETFQKILQDPLTRAMLPIPHPPGENLYFLEDPHDDLGLYLTNLSRMSSPLRPVVKPAWTFKMKDLERELRASNIQPLVLVQANQKSQPLVDAITRLGTYTPRTVIIAGRSEVVVRAPFKRITTRIRDFDLSDLISLPLEGLGALMIRRYVRMEDLDAPIESRQDRRERQIRERTQK